MSTKKTFVHRNFIIVVKTKNNTNVPQRVNGYIVAYLYNGIPLKKQREKTSEMHSMEECETTG